MRLNAKCKRRPYAAGSIAYRMLAVLGVGFLAWVWWQYGRSSGPAMSSSSSTNSPTTPKAPGQVISQPVVSNVPPPIAPPPVTRPLAVVTDEARPALVVTSIPPAIALATNTNPPVAIRTNVVHADTPGRAVRNVYEAQLVMARQGISSGSLDGAIGSQTRAAIRAYQQRENLPATGELDAETKASMILSVPPYTTYTVTEADLGRLQPISPTWLGKSQQTALDYETILELVAERGQAHPGFIKRLNPEVNWTNVVAGTEIQIPNVSVPRARAKAAFAIIHLAEKNLQVFDAGTNLVAHFPCSIAQRVEKRPVGELHVAVVAPNPNYTFNPEVFPESAEARSLNRKLILPPGPNNPVGTAWIGLDKPGYGIHGTPSPEAVGRTESHGCFRLANWNAEFLVRLVTVGTTVYVNE